jgi:methylated-DNA-[protein]-cysteine S-methyltransferase
VTISYRDADATLAVLSERLSPRVLELPRRLDDARRQLDEYFAGDRTDFDLELDLALSAGFRRKVLGHLGRVPYGEVVTYKYLAVKSGSPGASRAVGSTMATNPIPIVLPCHRVLGSSGSLTGYAGGLDRKEQLLRLEGAIL